MIRLCLLLVLCSPLAAATYNVGPGQPLSTIGAVPWATLGPGDVVRIHWRSTPYAEKWVLCRQGASGNPITIQGVPNTTTGELPVITGANAVTAPGLNYWGENRGVLKIGGANTPADTMPQWIVVENLEFRSAHPNYTFTDDTGTPGVAYAGNAAGIFVEKVKHLVVRNCTLTDCGNGFFVAPGSVGGTGNPNLTEDVYLGHCYIHGNGINASAFEHNSYCECNGIVYEYNRYGPLRSGANGNALKDRSANCVVRYNWIESGNRQLDLVEADGSGIQTLAGYSTTFVYGNILIEPNGAGNSQIIHYGGDNGTTSTYRKGTLYLYNNTIVSTRTGNTTLIRLSTNDETCDCRNNIVYVTAAGSALGLIDNTGVLNFRNNWFKTGFVSSHSGGSMAGTVNNQGGNVTGTSPGFLNEGGQDFSLAAASTCRDAGTGQHASTSAHPLSREYVKHQQGQNRFADAVFDIGAFEYNSGTPVTPPAAPSAANATANTTLGATLTWTDNSNNESGFRVERQTGAGAFTILGTVGANVTTFNDTGLTAGQSYTYRVCAYNTAGDSAFATSNTITGDNSGGGGGGGGSGGGGSGGGGGGGGGCVANATAWTPFWLAALALVRRRRPD
ncbi:MAG: fibronectin type III domain-containing protein [Planctomycetes bacterium]|nr:fibronectin type III domain-containing protein [Planctomycetota bacterium]MCL4729041.1 fibronectin type III domain-containing protein [Planctomycetota bacterium]